MADSSHFSYTKPSHLPPSLPVGLKGGVGPSKAKSLTRFLCKFLFFALFLVAIPLFPSQAPGFISQSLLTKFWELVHLLFIGVAVSYGLFCRRNVDVDFDAHTTTSDDSEESYVSRVFRVSSIFEDVDNSCGYGDKNVYQNLYSESYKASESFVGSSNENAVIGEQKKIGSFDSDSGFEYSCDNNLREEAWNSQYFQGESVVVVAQPDCSLNRYGESGSMMGHKSLNLPIRSLRPGDREQGSHEINDGCESSSCSKDSSNSPCHGGIGEKFGDMEPTNLESRFDESDSFSPIPWQSRSERMELGGDVGVNVASRSHFRPLSVDETQFESLKSKSLWSSESFSSRASSTVSDSPNGLSPSHGVCSELEDVRMDESGKAKMDELEKGKSFRWSYPSDSKQESKKAALNAFHIRRYSTNGSLFEKNSRKSFEDDSKDRSKGKREALLSSDVGRSATSLKFDGNLGDLVSASLRDTISNSKREAALSSDVGRSISSKFDGFFGNLVNSSFKDASKSKREVALNSDVGISGSPKFDGNSRNLVKASPRGKSVRTVRSRRYAAEAMQNEERSGNHFSNKLDQKVNGEVEEAVYQRKQEMKNVGSNNLSSNGTKKHDLVDNHSPLNMPKATSSELHSTKTRELFENLATESKEEPEKEAENVQVSSDIESVTDSVSDAGSNTHEVDRKAGEFIAKFREQIRLQKMASIDRSKGHNYFR